MKSISTIWSREERRGNIGENGSDKRSIGQSRVALATISSSHLHSISIANLRSRSREDYVRKACSVRAYNHLGPLEEVDDFIDVWVAVIHDDLFIRQAVSEALQQLVLVFNASVHLFASGQVDHNVALFLGKNSDVERFAGSHDALTAGGDAGDGCRVDELFSKVSAERGERRGEKGQNTT